MHASWHSVLLGAALALGGRLAHAQESTSEVLVRVAPSVVQINAGEDAVGTGFVYPTPRHVTTAYSVVNRDGVLTVVLAGGKVAPARVVAWSEADDLAILELPVAVSAAPLQLEPAMGLAGQDVILLGHPTPLRSERADEPVRRILPTPRFGFVGLVSSGQVHVDVASWPGYDGAPILTTVGRVLGVLSGRAERRLALLDAASVGRIEAVRQKIGKQPAFDAHPLADSGVFSGVYVAPWQAYHQVGAGLLTGYRYRWLAASLALTFSHASFTPLDADRLRARWSVAYEGYVTADWAYTKRRKLCLGAGLGLTATFFDVRQNGRKVDLESGDSGESRIDPLFVLQSVEGPVLLGASYAPLAEAARLDIGVVFGR